MSRRRKKRQREPRSAERAESSQREVQAQALRHVESVLNVAGALLYDFARSTEGLPCDGVARSLSPAERAKRAYDAAYQCSEWISGLLMLRWWKTGVDGMGSVIPPDDMLEMLRDLQELCGRYVALERSL